jgi:hypothetical protein
MASSSPRSCKGPKGLGVAVRKGGRECSTLVGVVTVQALTGTCAVPMPAADAANAAVVVVAVRWEGVCSLRLPRGRCEGGCCGACRGGRGGISGAVVPPCWLLIVPGPHAGWRLGRSGPQTIWAWGLLGTAVPEGPVPLRVVRGLPVCPGTAGGQPPWAAPLVCPVRFVGSASGMPLPEGGGEAVAWVGSRGSVGHCCSGATEPERRSANICAREVPSIGGGRGWGALLWLLGPGDAPLLRVAGSPLRSARVRWSALCTALALARGARHCECGGERGTVLGRGLFRGCGLVGDSPKSRRTCSATTRDSSGSKMTWRFAAMLKVTRCLRVVCWARAVCGGSSEMLADRASTECSTGGDAGGSVTDGDPVGVVGTGLGLAAGASAWGRAGGDRGASWERSNWVRCRVAGRWTSAAEGGGLLPRGVACGRAGSGRGSRRGR